jgi:hypothetical protein
MTDTAWKPLLEKAPAATDDRPTGAANYLAVMLWENLQGGEAEAIWKKEAENGDVLALRNLAAAARQRGDPKASLEYMKKAFAVEKGESDQAFAEEYVRLLLFFKDYEGAWKVYISLPEKTAGAERVQLLAAQAAVEVGEYTFVEGIFSRELAVIQEGETTLTDIWFKAEAQKLAKKQGVPYTEELLKDVTRTLNPPVTIDFRMRIEN